ncbi:hypothetical protein I3843_13G124300 [Carya illinoinensis]|uniref:Uncharacterized protein n=1 Tax=Carya illinoinensis TaxID=32201 RepID=A0A922AP56_CARIL|nr:hypothetical protein I3842_13G139200 [Carya illinoinensis]KAG7950621.1 hypothetical protein I3843_13G124300 [Carya illinoinensis]
MLRTRSIMPWPSILLSLSVEICEREPLVQRYAEDGLNKEICIMDPNGLIRESHSPEVRVQRKKMSIEREKRVQYFIEFTLKVFPPSNCIYTESITNTLFYQLTTLLHYIMTTTTTLHLLKGNV